MKTTIVLSPEKFKEIYSNEEFRNQVAYAHSYSGKNGESGKITCSYPTTYIVTEEQIAEANKEVERRKKEVVKANKNKLMFVGMGMTYEPRYDGDVCNHRIRTEFKNSKGHHFFIEVGTWGEESMRVDFSIDRELEKEYDKKLEEIHSRMEGVKKYSPEWHRLNEKREEYMKQPFYNYKNLERGQTKENSIKYTLQNVLEFVNKHFDCNFKEIVIDNFNVTQDDFISVSPSK
jgi:hypothetical protein